MSYTIDDIIKLNPCSDYPLSRLTELADGRESVTPAEIAALDIPADDRLWVLTKLMTAEQRDRYSRRVASDVLHLWDAPRVVVEWLQTGDPELREAAARAAAKAAAKAARAAARAAWGAEAAEAAAAAAAWAAARAAARAAAKAAKAARAAAKAAWDAGCITAMEKYTNWAAEEIEWKR